MRPKLHPCLRRHRQCLAPATGTQVQHPQTITQGQSLNHPLRRGILQFDETLGICRRLMDFSRVFRDFKAMLQAMNILRANALARKGRLRRRAADLGRIDPQKHRRAATHRFKRCVTLIAQRLEKMIIKPIRHIQRLGPGEGWPPRFIGANRGWGMRLSGEKRRQIGTGGTLPPQDQAPPRERPTKGRV